MPYTFTQKCTEEIQIDNLTTEQFMETAIKAAKALEWTFGNINSIGFVAYTNNGFFNWNAQIKLSINGTTANIISQSRNVNYADFKKDEMNLAKFLMKLKDLKEELMPGLKSTYMELQANVA